MQRFSCSLSSHRHIIVADQHAPLFINGWLRVLCIKAAIEVNSCPILGAKKANGTELIENFYVFIDTKLKL